MEHSNLAKLISNYGSRLWSMISVFIFIPLYIRFLGSENYGLIGFYALLLGIISFADSGMSSAIIKEFSQEYTSNYKYSVFRHLEKYYVLVCVVICIIIFFSSSFIVDHWITAKGISRGNLIYYVRLIGFGVTTQLISSLYFGALFALNNQIKSNILQLLWSFSKSALVIFLFIIFSKSIELYFIWQLVCNVTYVLILRLFIIKKLKRDSGIQMLRTEFNKLPLHITKYIGGMIFIAIISAINIQADKLITSSMFDLSTFGFYNIASSLSQIPVILATPLAAFVFPLFSKYSNSQIKNYNKLTLIIFNKVFYLINLLVILATIVILFYTKEILLLWTKKSIPDYLLNTIAFDAKILILGSLFLALQFPLYYLLLSKGKTKYTIYQGVIQLFIGLPLLFFFSNKYGLRGVPIPWLLINFASLVYLFYIVSKFYLKFNTHSFYKNILIGPIFITVVINSIIYLCYKYSEFNFIPYIILASLLSLTVSVLLFNKVERQGLLSYKHLYNFPNE